MFALGAECTGPLQCLLYSVTLDANGSERQQTVNQKGTNKHKLSRFQKKKTEGVDIFWERKEVTCDQGKQRAAQKNGHK